MNQIIEVSVIVRTLLAAGYSVREALRQPTHLEIFAARVDELESSISYLIAITDADSFSADHLLELQHSALVNGSQLVLVASSSGASNFSVDEFLDRLGGPIPSWRALSADYPTRLVQLSRNNLPAGESGEAWRLFEDAVSDGLEFLFGRRVKRLGGGKRGSRVADCICRTRDDAIILVDAKAASDGFDAANENLRALKEYALQQKRVQQGQQPLSSCLIVSSWFDQDATRLQKTGIGFLTETGVPIAFINSEILGDMISLVSSAGLRQRLAIHWKRVFGVPGMIGMDEVKQELQRINQLQIPRA